MTATGSRLLPNATGGVGVGVDRHIAARPVRALTLRQWVGRAPEAWWTPGWRRTFAGWAIAGAVGDMATTMSLGHVDGVGEANPLSAAGQALVGSVPLYMLVTTVIVALLVAILPVRPVSGATRIVWSAIAVLGVAKIAVTVLNLSVLQSALNASIDRL